jgi:hypothetical protein
MNKFNQSFFISIKGVSHENNLIFNHSIAACPGGGACSAARQLGHHLVEGCEEVA